jgi:glycosyltransferase involved in cell wall biosynthesis
VRNLHVITTLGVGGAEMHLLSQVRGQVARGHEVRVAWVKGQGELAPDFESAGARCMGPVGLGPGTLPRLFAHLRWAEIVHSHLLKADMLCAVSAALAGRRRVLVASKHNDEQVLLRPLVSRVHGLLSRLVQRTIVLSDHVGRFVERHGRVPSSRLVRVYYGHDPRPFERAAAMEPGERAAVRAGLGLGAQDVVAICVARFAPQKAHDVLLRAFAAARAERAELRLLLVGDDPFGDGRERAEALAAELELGSAVRFVGIRRDVPLLLGASDIFVMSSLWEGFGLVFLEAMSAGLPVVGSRVSAVPEVVEEGVTGLLVPPSDPPALAAALVALASDGELRERQGRAGRERVRRNFALERMVEETLAVYASLGAGRS